MARISSGVSQRIVSIHILHEIESPPITQHAPAKVVEALEDDTFTVNETVANIVMGYLEL
jgi:hypothetical protein